MMDDFLAKVLEVLKDGPLAPTELLLRLGLYATDENLRTVRDFVLQGLLVLTGDWKVRAPAVVAGKQEKVRLHDKGERLYGALSDRCHTRIEVVLHNAERRPRFVWVRSKSKGGIILGTPETGGRREETPQTCLLMNKAEAKRLINALQKFVDDEEPQGMERYDV